MTSPVTIPSPASAPPDSPQGQLHALLRRELPVLDATLREQVHALGLDKRQQAPASGGWSVDQVLEHLCLGNALYLRAMEAAVERALQLPAAGDAAPRGRWRPTLGGRLLVRSLTSARRIPRPREMTPGRVSRPGVLEALAASHGALLELLDRATGLEWRDVRLRSPFATWVALTLGDAALVILRHGQRHARQVARLRAELA